MLTTYDKLASACAVLVFLAGALGWWLGARRAMREEFAT